MTEKKPLSLSPKYMTDSMAYWPLSRVVSHLKEKEAEGKRQEDADCRLFYRSGVSMFDAVLGELAARYGASRGMMGRWLSYHAACIAREDEVVRELSEYYVNIRRQAVEQDNQTVYDILNSMMPYSPVKVSPSRGSFYVYDGKIQSEVGDLAVICGVSPSQVAQIFMVKSILTEDMDVLKKVIDRLFDEVENWEKWLKYRLGVMKSTVEYWVNSEATESP